MLKTKKINQIDSYDLNKLVQETYGRPYDFQQQNGCQDRGTVNVSIPSQDMDEHMHDSIPDKVNGSIMGVKFKTWLERDPEQPLTNPDDQSPWSLNLFWERNFYPDLQTVLNDLHSKGLVEAGDYEIKIDW